MPDTGKYFERFERLGPRIERVPGGRLMLDLAVRAGLRLRAERVCVVYRSGDGQWIYRYPGGLGIDDRPRVGPTITALERRARDYFLQEYEPKPGNVIVDVGAGVGLELHLFSRLVGPKGRVYSIEAHPGTYAKLRRRQLLNHAFNVEPVWAAIADEVGHLTISDTDRHIANTVIGATDGRRVPALTLDAFVESRGIERIDFLKMNIEGAERLAIRGMASSIRITRNICIGCHDFLAERYDDEGMRTKELVREFLLDNGFDVVDRRPGDTRPWARDYLYGSRRVQAQS